MEGPRYPTALHVRGAAGHHSQSPGAVFAFGHFMAMDIGYHVMGSRSSTVSQCWSVSPWRHPALNVCPNILPDLSTCFMARSIREPLRCLAAAFFMVPGGFSHCSTWLPATCQRRTSPSCRASTECGPMWSPQNRHLDHLVLMVCGCLWSMRRHANTHLQSLHYRLSFFCVFRFLLDRCLDLQHHPFSFLEGFLWKRPG